MSDRPEDRTARPGVAGLDEASIPVLTERLTLPLADPERDPGIRLPRPPEPELTLPEPPDLDFRLPEELLDRAAAQPSSRDAVVPAQNDLAVLAEFAPPPTVVPERRDTAVPATMPETISKIGVPEPVPTPAPRPVGAANDDAPASTARPAIEPAPAQPAIPNFLTKAAVAAHSPAPPTIDASPNWARIEIELRESVLLALSERLPTDVERIVRERMSAGIDAMITRLESDVRRAVALTLREIVERAVRAEFERLRAARR